MVQYSHFPSPTVYTRLVLYPFATRYKLGMISAYPSHEERPTENYSHNILIKLYLHFFPKSILVSCIIATITAATAKSLQSCPTLCDPIDGSPPGSSVHGICQARVLEWGAIAFSPKGVILSHKKECNLATCSNRRHLESNTTE